MKLPEAVQIAVKNNDAVTAGQIAEFLRTRARLNYKGVYQFFHKFTAISEADFDALMYEADNQ